MRYKEKCHKFIQNFPWKWNFESMGVGGFTSSSPPSTTKWNFELMAGYLPHSFPSPPPSPNPQKSNPSYPLWLHPWVYFYYCLIRKNCWMTDKQVRANSVDPDRMPENPASDQGLHYLSFTKQFLRHQQGVNGYISNFRTSTVRS